MKPFEPFELFKPFEPSWWAWGDTPAGFKKFRPDRKRMVVLREALEPYLDRLIAWEPLEKGASHLHGRDRLYCLSLARDETVLIRPYRHGGLFRQLTGDFFFTWPPRPFRELAITEEVRRRGVPTIEMLGAWVERVWGPLYRGWLATRQIQGAQDLWAALQDGLLQADGKSLLEVLARSLRRMHRRGIYHGDLNLKNILIRREMGAIQSYIIDFDRAKLFPGELPRRKAKENLDRLLRSVNKLDPGGRYLSRKDWDLFVRLYLEASDA